MYSIDELKEKPNLYEKKYIIDCKNPNFVVIKD